MLFSEILQYLTNQIPLIYIYNKNKLRQTIPGNLNETVGVLPVTDILKQNIEERGI